MKTTDIEVSARAFDALQNLNISELLKCSEKEIRPFLMCMVRSVLLDEKCQWQGIRKEILSILVRFEVVNNIVALLQVNYNELESDIKKEQQLR
jgi:integrator complex subunit 2